MSSDMKIVYIAGWGRSGSTILDNALGQVNGFFSAGELFYLWERGFVQNRRCGCGAPFRECETWRAVLDEAFGELPAGEARDFAGLARASARTRRLPAHVSGRHTLPSRYGAALARLYRALAETTGASVIVDSSKSPGYGAVLASVEGIDVRVIHLVRDPRAVAYSWRRRKITSDEARPREMHRHGPIESSIFWDVWNLGAEFLWRSEPNRYLRLRYEDFVAQPRENVLRILDWLGEPPENLPFVGERAVRLEVSHTISGNPSRFRTGLVEIEPDDEWLSAMRTRDRLAVTAITAPLLGRFGYPLRLRRSESPVTKEVLT